MIYKHVIIIYKMREFKLATRRRANFCNKHKEAVTALMAVAFPQHDPRHLSQT